jgi:hypothetical protein
LARCADERYLGTLGFVLTVGVANSLLPVPRNLVAFLIKGDATEMNWLTVVAVQAFSCQSLEPFSRGGSFAAVFVGVQLYLAARLRPDTLHDCACRPLEFRAGYLDDRRARVGEPPCVHVGNQAVAVEIECDRNQRLARFNREQIYDEMKCHAPVGHGLTRRDFAAASVRHSVHQEGADGQVARAVVHAVQGHVADRAVLSEDADESFQVDRARYEMPNRVESRKPVLLELNQREVGALAHVENLTHG